MSLDVYLYADVIDVSLSEPKIYVRENGQNQEITREEWDKRFPGREPFTFDEQMNSSVFSANITHNLGKMAEEAGIYKHLWRPEEINANLAKDITEGLQLGLDKLKADPKFYKRFNPSNGWGDYEALVRFVEDYLQACLNFPEATIGISR